MKIFKRNGVEQDFCLDKIKNAVAKANKSVEEEHRMNDEQMEKVVSTVQKKLEKFDSAKVEDIQDLVEAALVKHNKYEVAKAYIIFRQNKKDKKKYNEIEEKCLTILSGDSAEARGDNANKHIDLNSSARDYLAGTVCKSLCQKELPKQIMEAHQKGLIHWHDSDYYKMNLHNCDLIDMEEMLQNGFMMDDTWIDRPKRFSTACNLVAQISLIVSGSQYGGQSMTWTHLVPFVKSTFDDCKVELLSIMSVLPKFLSKIISPWYDKMVEMMVKRDIHVGIKTYQYQILCHHSSNGQTPFVSNSICLREAQNDEDRKWLAFIIKEILERRIKGVKDQSGQYVSPLFPKLLYWESEGLNLNKSDPYYYLTELAAKCIATRIQPDINSEKKSREIKAGQIIPSMGCRSWLAPIWEEVEYPKDTVFDWQVITGDNIQYEGAPGKNFNYDKPSRHEVLPLVLDKSSYVINFNGNSGWVKEVKDDTVVVLKPKVYGRWNNGVITLNIPYCALEAKREFSHPNEMDKRKTRFFEILDSRLELVHEGLRLRYDSVRKIKAKNSPILWMHGALYRNNDPELTVGEIMDKYPARPSISVGYVGLFEACIALIDMSNTTDKGKNLSKEILTHINNKIGEWKKAEGIGYSLYGTPEESLTYKFALALQKEFGYMESVTDKDYVVNSYHVDPREEINAFDKLRIEGEYLDLTPGGAVSYIETGDLTNNIEAILELLRFMYDNSAYAEINRVIGVCHKCGFQGKIELNKTDNGDFQFICPRCGNTDDSMLNVVARLCGYIGKVNAGETNRGRLDDIVHRVLHLS